MIENGTQRYFDFSEDDEILDGFNPGPIQEEWRLVIAETIQIGLGRKNPISGIKELIAFGVAAQAHQFQKTATDFRKCTRVIYLLLILNLVLIGILIAKI